MTKKQFIVINDLGENNKFGWIGHGINGIALGRLLTSHGDSGEGWGIIYGHPEKDEFYAGVWAGDRIVIAGDNDFPDKYDIQTTTPENSDLTLYDKVEETGTGYENVTDKVIKWLAKDDETADLLAERSMQDNELLKKLSGIVLVDNNETMRNSLQKIYGANWPEKVKQ